MLSQSNGQTVPQFGCSIGKCSDSKSVFCLLDRHWGCEDEVGWRTAGDALEGSEVLVPEGTGGLSSHAAVETETGFCSQQFVVTNKIPKYFITNHFSYDFFVVK